jgi:hypothetical protein
VVPVTCAVVRARIGTAAERTAGDIHFASTIGGALLFGAQVISAIYGISR